MSNCPVCLAVVPAKAVGQVGLPRTYCSAKCRSRAQKERDRAGSRWDRSPRLCADCGGEYVPRMEIQRFCSPACRKRMENKRRYGGSGSNSNYYRMAFVEERGGRCELCGLPGDLEVHHRVSVAAGGSHEASNLLVVCGECHTAHHRAELAERKPDLSRQIESFAEGRPFPSPPSYDRIVVESGSMFPADPEPPALNKWGDPIDTVYDEVDPRSWT